jgi:pimeloyl-ACP methyl ester carboxylesterase
MIPASERGLTPARLELPAAPKRVERVPVYEEQLLTKNGAFTGSHSEGDRNRPAILYLCGTGNDRDSHEFLREMRRQAYASGIGMISADTHRTGHEVERRVPNFYSRVNERGELVKVVDPYAKTRWMLTGSRTATKAEVAEDMDGWIEYITTPVERGGLGYSSVVIVGHSIGASDAGFYGIKGRYRDKVKALGFLSPPDQRGVEQARTGNLQEVLDNAKQKIAGGKGNETIEVPDLALHQTLIAYDDTHDANYGVSRIFDYASYENGTNDLLDRLSEIPVLAILGSEDDYITAKGTRDAEDTKRILEGKLQAPGSRVVSFLTGHSLELFESDVARELVEFVNQNCLPKTN